MTTRRKPLSPGDHHVLIVVAGGTFGMHPTDRGLAPDPGFPDVLATMLEQAIPAHESVHTTTVFIDPPIDSSDAGPTTTTTLAHIIRDEAAKHSDFSGAIVIHGSDTLAFTAARLAFELHDIPCPVVVTGSQFPHGHPTSDAPENLGLSLRTVLGASPDVPVTGTWVVFGGHVLPALRATKVSSDDREAFRAALPLSPNPRGVPSLPETTSAPPARVISFRFSPSVIAADLDAAVGGSPDALILETYGAGNAPMSRHGMRETIRRIASCIPVVAISQCSTGGVQLGRYATGFALAEAGVIDGSDLTLEAALAKLGFLLDRGVPPGQEPTDLRALMQQNFLGECASPRVSESHPEVGMIDEDSIDP